MRGTLSLNIELMSNIGVFRYERRYYQSEWRSDLVVSPDDVESIVGGLIGDYGDLCFLVQLRNQQRVVLRNEDVRRCIYKRLIDFYQVHTRWLSDDEMFT